MAPCPRSGSRHSSIPCSPSTAFGRVGDCRRATSGKRPDVSEGSAGRRAVLYATTGIVAGALVWLVASIALGAVRDELQAGIVPALLALVAAVAATAAAARSHIAALRARAEAAERERREG